MHLVIVQDYLRMGGTERQSLFLADYARRQGHAVTLLLFRPGGRLEKTAREGPYATDCLQRRDTGLPLYAPGLLRRLRVLNPDAVLCMGRTANCYAGFMQRALPDAAVIATLRTGKMLFPLHSWSLKVVRAVLVNSNWWKRRMLERGFSPDRVQVVHNSVLLEHSPEECANLRKELRQKANLGEDACIFLSVASFRSGKRHQDLLRLFAETRRLHPEVDARLWLVGDGPERVRCQRWAAENGLGTRVRFWGYQNDPLRFYAAGDVAVSASREDSLPNFLIESQAAGLPIIAYDFRGVGECCLPQVTGSIVPMGDSLRFVTEMVDLQRKGDRWQQMRAQAPAFARERFSPLRQAEEKMAFIQRLITASSPSVVSFSA